MLINESPDKNLLNGAKAMLNNSKRLLVSANKLSEIGNYGHASALLILACEEAIKAIVYYTNSYGIMLDPENNEKFNYSHKARPGLASGLLAIGVYASKLYDDSQNNNLESSVYALIKILLEDVANNKITNEVLSIVDWWKDANKVKQMGLYVDRAGDDWESPLSITKEQYQSNYENTKDILRGARLVWFFERYGFPEGMGELDIDSLASRLANESRGLE